MVADTATWGTERIVAAKPTQTVSLSGYEFSFDGLVQRPGPRRAVSLPVAWRR